LEGKPLLQKHDPFKINQSRWDPKGTKKGWIDKGIEQIFFRSLIWKKVLLSLDNLRSECGSSFGIRRAFLVSFIHLLKGQVFENRTQKDLLCMARLADYLKQIKRPYTYLTFS
jgi:hypothetical protein